MSQKNQENLFVTPAPGEAESTRMAEIRRGKRPAVDQLEGDEMRRSQAPRFSVDDAYQPATSIEGVRPGETQSPTPALRDTVDLEAKGYQSPISTAVVLHLEERMIQKANILGYVQKELSNLFKRQGRLAIETSELKGNLEETSQIIRLADKPRILERYEAWRKLLVRAKNQLQKELDKMEEASQTLKQRATVIKKFRGGFIEPFEKLVVEAGKAIDTFDGLIKFLSRN